MVSIVATVHRVISGTTSRRTRHVRETRSAATSSDIQRDFRRDGCWRAGCRASWPVRFVNVGRRASCRCSSFKAARYARHYRACIPGCVGHLSFVKASSLSPRLPIAMERWPLFGFEMRDHGGKALSQPLPV